ncbi:hypothetical protein [Hyphomonas oceanitis]|uniref:hypothetical protein n=1 Tax=Hyphomonas oceanitis TaxID=81033 RepID=UPI0030031FD7
MQFKSGDYSRVPSIRTTDVGALVLAEDPFIDGDKGQRRLCVVKWDDQNKLLGPKMCADNFLNGFWFDAATSPDGKFITIVASKVYPDEEYPTLGRKTSMGLARGYFDAYELDESSGELRHIRRVDRFGFRPELGFENSIIRVLSAGGSKFDLISVHKIGQSDDSCRGPDRGCLREELISYDVKTGQSETILNLTSERHEGMCWVLFDHYGASAGMAAAEPKHATCEYVALDMNMGTQFPLGEFFPESVIVGWVDPLRFRIATRHLSSPIVIQRMQGRLGMFSDDRRGAPPVEVECEEISARNCQRVEGIRTSRANVLVDTGSKLKLYSLKEH